MLSPSPSSPYAQLRRKPGAELDCWRRVPAWPKQQVLVRKTDVPQHQPAPLCCRNGRSPARPQGGSPSAFEQGPGLGRARVLSLAGERAKSRGVGGERHVWRNTQTLTVLGTTQLRTLRTCVLGSQVEFNIRCGSQNSPITEHEQHSCSFHLLLIHASSFELL